MKTKKKIIKSSAKRVVVRKKKNGSKKKKSVKTAALVRHSQNPIISPNTKNGWEAWQTFNPGVILLNDRVHFLYRAIGEDGLSRFGYAASSDGFHVDERLSYPVYEHQVGQRPSFNIFSYFSGGSFGGSEDSRIVRIGDEDTLYMTYTACDEGLRVALTSMKVKDFLNKRWNWKPPVLISPPGEVHKNWVIFPEKIGGKYAILHSISPEILIDYFDDLNFDGRTYVKSFYDGKIRKNCWDSWVRGAGAPPIKTEYGWLVFYQAMEGCDFSKYKVGAMLLDPNDPTKILSRSKEPVLEPSELYENVGFKSGIVYATGAVVKDGLLLVYYGGADNYVCVVSAPFEEFVEALMKGAKPKLKIKTLKNK
ncbi:MAG: glycosidase [Candidatus Zambryskibacteria bacterium]|nr:glycosidase [Candidatus Zambryskibacteria bacterium]